MRILVLSPYYNRPILVRNALGSLLRASEHHSDWELAFGDDGSQWLGRPIVEEVLKDHLEKITFVQTNMSFQDKIDQGISLGKFANQIMKASKADIGIVLCDDDELHPMYLKNLSDFFENNNAKYCYSKVHVYNPLFQKSKDVTSLVNRYNVWTGKIDPVGKVDASQVAWRLDCCRQDGAWFEESTKFIEGKPWVRDTDRGFFENLRDKCGECSPTGFVSQYKGIHDYQLLWHKNAGEDSLKAYDQMCRELAGKKL